jgi:hypothetical protein
MLFGRDILRREAAGGEADPVAPGGETGNAAAEPVVDAKALQTEIDRLKAENAEKDQAARYWHDQVKAQTPAADKTPAAAKTDEDEEDPLEIISKKGAKGLDELLAKRGYMREEEVESRINSKAVQIATENQLAKDYPDLQNSDSDFFKATAVEYAALIAAKVPQTIAMKLAAQQAELQGYKTGKRLTQSEKDERENRARAAGGDKGKKAAPVEEEDSGDLDEFQARICEEMEITQEQYKARAKKGVVVGSK